MDIPLNKLNLANENKSSILLIIRKELNRPFRETATNTVLAKKGLKEVIEQLCYYQLLYIDSADGF